MFILGQLYGTDQGVTLEHASSHSASHSHLHSTNNNKQQINLYTSLKIKAFYWLLPIVSGAERRSNINKRNLS